MDQRILEAMRKGMSRDENKDAFLPNNEQVKFHSISVLELFTLEDFKNSIIKLLFLYLSKNSLNVRLHHHSLWINC